jgi:peptide/nickel transport system substrate-binding protein
MRPLSTLARSLLLVAALLVGAAGAQPAPGEAGTLRIATAAAAPTLDPTLNTSQASMELTLHVFDSLFAYDAGYRIVPSLATGYEISDDGLVYEISLAEGIRFHDGSEMTSEDVIASIERARQIGQNAATLGEVIAELEPNGDYGVTMTLSRPYGAIVEILATPLPQVAVMPAELAASTDPLNPPDLIGTGPYRIASWVPDQALVLERFDDYVPGNDMPASGLAGDRVAYFQTLRFEPVPQAQTRVAGLNRGDFGYAQNLPVATYGSLQANPDVEPQIITESSLLAFWLNHRDGELLSDVNMRRAIVAALDMEAILNVTASGNPEFYQTSPSLFWPEQVNWYRPDVGEGIYNEPDMDEVQRRLDAAGYDGETLTIVTNRDYEYMYAEAVEVARQLNEAGINAELEVLDWSAALALLNEPTGWDMFASSAIFKPSPLDWYIIIAPDALLAPGYESERMQELLDAGAAASDLEERQRIYTEVQELVWEEVPDLNIGLLNTLDALRPDRIEGYERYFTPRFWNTY